MGTFCAGACGAELHETHGRLSSTHAPAHRAAHLALHLRAKERVIAGITVGVGPSAARFPAVGVAGTTPW